MSGVRLLNITIQLMFAGYLSFIEIQQIKYLNNIVKQDHRFIKKINRPMMEFKVLVL
jgi:putative transposase